MANSSSLCTRNDHVDDPEPFSVMLRTVYFRLGNLMSCIRTFMSVIAVNILRMATMCDIIITMRAMLHALSEVLLTANIIAERMSKVIAAVLLQNCSHFSEATERRTATDERL